VSSELGEVEKRRREYLDTLGGYAEFCFLLVFIFFFVPTVGSVTVAVLVWLDQRIPFCFWYIHYCPSGILLAIFLFSVVTALGVGDRA
jgi:hypothetical protein